MAQIITAPLTDETVSSLSAGDEVLINGIIFTGRDAVHKKLCDLIEKNSPLPMNLRGQIIYFAGPTPTPPGKPVGSIGPTTSYRMDAYSPILIEKTGLKGMIGKGQRSKEVIQSMMKYCAVYFAAIGGAGALISKSIVKSEVVAYPELGPEAIYRLTVKNFPAIVATDCRGNDFYIQGPTLFANKVTSIGD
jgi:fumarate hydratase subunit beta